MFLEGDLRGSNGCALKYPDNSANKQQHRSLGRGKTDECSLWHQQRIHKVGLFKEALLYTAQIWQQYKY
jgi:hypothetical protein